MWQEIRLTSLGVIAAAELDLGRGLTVITGETGAGKTMVVTAVGLLRGGRSDAHLVRHGDERARVEARIDVSDLPGVASIVGETGAEVEDGTLIVGRTVSSEGRSRAYLGGASVPAGVLADLSDHLVAVHGQSDQHRLLKPVAQRDALDHFGGEQIAGLLAEYEPAYARWTEVRRLLDELTTQSRERARELDLLIFGIEEIAAVAPLPDEDVDLLAVENRLAHAEVLAQASAQARELLSGDGADAVDAADALALAGRAQSLLNSVRDHDSRLNDLASRLDEVGYLLTDLATELGDYAGGVDVDPRQLAGVQERRAALLGLTRKYGPRLEDVLAWAERAALRREDLQGDDDRIDRLRAEQTDLTDTLLAVSLALSKTRTSAAAELSSKVSQELDALAMPHARVEVQVRSPTGPTARDLGPGGIDQVEFLLAANAGTPALALTKGASGGELSRVMLALEVVLADRTSAPTFVFDEVDAGVGGKAAVEVGRRLARLSRHAQVIVVTHLPQVAAFADRHYHVLKSEDGTVTTSGVQQLDDSERVSELSRMLAGLEGSSSAKAHARELLELAEAERAAAS